MRALKRLGIFLLLAVFTSSCGSSGVMLRAKKTIENMPPSAISPEGTPIYDLSAPVSKPEWARRFVVITTALSTLDYCTGDKISKDMLGEIALIPIVILPDSELQPHNLWGITDLETIFVSSYHFDLSSMRHEMLHNYFFIAQKGLFGDVFHLNQAFAKSKCW